MIRYRLVGDPAYAFRIALEQFAGTKMDNIHKQVSIDLTKEAKRNLDVSVVRPWESGSRPNYRMTGKLTGRHGNRSAIVTRILIPGEGRQGKGVGFPDVELLDRVAKHWRRLEYGDKALGYENVLPGGVFINGGRPQPLQRGRSAGDVFMTSGEYYRSSQRRGGSRNRRLTVREDGYKERTFHTRKRVKPIQGKHYLREAWEYVVGPAGRNIAQKYHKAIDEAFSSFK